jgi:hypothetical protein
MTISLQMYFSKNIFKFAFMSIISSSEVINTIVNFILPYLQFIIYNSSYCHAIGGRERVEKEGGGPIAMHL